MSLKCRFSDGRGYQVLLYVWQTFVECRERGGGDDNVSDETCLKPDDVCYVRSGIIFGD